MSSVEPGTTETHAAGEPATIATFYSYKGGVGRTMALANVAWVLASAGAKVLVVDWDLESPGLNRYLRPFLRDPYLSRTTGVVEMIQEYGAAVEQLTATVPEGPQREAELAELLRAHTKVGRHTDTLIWEFPVPTGRIDFLGPGRQDENYSHAVARFEWSRFYDDQAGRLFTEALRASLLASEYDYVLIDSRTGHSDNAGVCTLVLPDVLVGGFNLSNQSIDGTAAVARQVHEQTRRDIRILPIPMRVEDVDRTKALMRRRYVERIFAGLVGPLFAGAPEEYWGQVEVRHSPVFAYEELLVPFTLEPGDRSTQAQAYVHIAAEISKGRISNLRPVPEERRRKIQSRFEELAVPGGRRTARIVHATRDRLWADWLRNELALLGISTLDSSTDGPPHGEEDPTYLLVVVSSALRNGVVLDRITNRYARLRGLGGSAEDTSILAVRVEETNFGEPIASMRGPNLRGLDEKAARNLLGSFLAPQPNAPAQPEGPAEAAESGARYPGTATAVWSSPRRNHEFVGREAQIEELRNSLLPGLPAVPVVLQGPLGVGKSQVALEFTYRFAADYDVVWWINAATVSSARRELAVLGSRLKVTSSSAPGAVQATLRALSDGAERHQRFLVVYDNARSPSDLEGLLPGGGRTHVVITSESGDWGSVGRPIEVAMPTAQEAAEEMLRQLPGMPRPLADALLERTGRLPQTVEYVTALISASGRPYAEAVDDLLRRLDPLPTAADLGYSPQARAAWELSLDALEAERPVAVKALRLLTHLSPSGVRLDLLRSPAALEALGEPGEPLSPAEAPSALRALANFALARTDYGVERLVADAMGLAFLRDRMTPQQRQASKEAAQRVLASWLPEDARIDKSGESGELAELDCHVGPSEAVSSADPLVRRWLVNQVRYRRRTQQLVQATELAEALRREWEADPAARREEQAELRLQLAVETANVHRDAGRFREAESVNREALEESRAVLGIQHPLTLSSALGRGAELRALGRSHDAFAEDQSTYDISRSVLGALHPRTLIAASNLALSLSMMGLPTEALDMQREAFDGFASELGQDHDLTWYAAGHVGGHYREIGEYETSLTQLQQAYRESRERFGESDLTTLNAARNLAATLRRLSGPRQITAARKLDDEALEGFLAYGGPDHHEVPASRLALAADLRLLGSAEEACREAALALKAYDNWGNDHPFRRICQIDLAVCQRAAGTDAGVEQTEEGWRGLRDVLGADRPLTLSAALCYANALVYAGRSAEALEVDRAAYAGFRERSGPDHPMTRIAAANLQDSEARVAGIETVSQRIEIDIEIPFI